MKDDIACAMKRGEVTMIVLADFSKAFDTVAFETVLKKLHALGFSKSFLMWISSYLTGRRQFVETDDKTSRLLDVTFGVPQGSVLGPVQFNLYVNDLSERLGDFVKCQQYADDTIIYTTDKPAHIKDCEWRLQEAVDLLKSWSSESNLSLKPTKTKVMLFSTPQLARFHGLEDHQVNLSVDGIKPLERVSTAKLLGTELHQSLKWNHDINTKISSCYATLSVLRKLKKIAPFHVKKRLAESLILSKLDYNDIVRYPTHDYLIKRLQRVQLAAAGFVCKCADLHDILKLKWLPIAERQEYHLAKLAYQAVNSEQWPEHLRPNQYVPSRTLRSSSEFKLSDELALVVHNIITASITEKKYPTLYKHALVSPIPKIHPPEDIEKDFRQISVIPVLGKVLEKVQISLNKSALTVTGNQHAFTQGRSTVSALINITQSWFNDTDNSTTGRNGIHALFLDFHKAFDLVDHSTLLSKLKAKNINKSLWLWIQSFLSSRTQQVKLPSTVSTIRPCPAGVPQGCVISPLLFNIHIDNIEDAIPNERRDQVRVCKYADDCTVFMKIQRGSESKMQAVLDSLQRWADINNMSLNTTKTKDMWICFLSVGSSEPERLRLSNVEIERVPTFELLGVWQQENLRWNHHINETVKKANKRLHYLRDCRKAQLPSDVGTTVYCTKIHPLLEYASTVWGGLPEYLANEIQRVQNRSLDIIGVPRDTLPALEQRKMKQQKRNCSGS